MGIHIDGAARHYKSKIWSKWPSDVGILWTYGNWSESDGDCDYLLYKKFEEITDQNLLKLWRLVAPFPLCFFARRDPLSTHYYTLIYADSIDACFPYILIKF